MIRATLAEVGINNNLLTLGILIFGPAGFVLTAITSVLGWLRAKEASKQLKPNHGASTYDKLQSRLDQIEATQAIHSDKIDGITTVTSSTNDTVKDAA